VKNKKNVRCYGISAGLLLLSALSTSCGGTGNSNSGGINHPPELSSGVCQGASLGGNFTGQNSASPANVMPVEVGGLSVCTNVNTPCTSVTVCIPGTQSCQTIDNILVDTGSYGLRIFSQALTANLCTSLPQYGRRMRNVWIRHRLGASHECRCTARFRTRREHVDSGHQSKLCFRA